MIFHNIIVFTVFFYQINAALVRIRTLKTILFLTYFKHLLYYIKHYTFNFLSVIKHLKIENGHLKF